MTTAESHKTETTTATESAKAHAEKPATVKKPTAKPSPKKSPKKAATAKKAPKKAANDSYRQPKWLAPVVKELAKHPDGMTRKALLAKLKANDLGGVLVKNPNLISQQTAEGERGFVYVLTTAGKAMAKKL